MILAGDVGGTNTRLASVSEKDGQGLLLEDLEVLPSTRYPGLGELVEAYLEKHPGSVEAACFAVAGPVVEGTSRVTNLPWVLEEEALARDLEARRVVLVNDLVGNAEGLAELSADSVETLQVGVPDPEGPAALVSPGTGVGMSILHRAGGRHVASPSEGSHAEYPARTDEEEALVSGLRKRLGRVEIEDLLSGTGLVRIHHFVRLGEGFEHEVPTAIGEGDAAAVSRAALEGGDAEARRALSIYVSMLGAVAGNLALTALPTAGLYLGGGIPPKILPALREEDFLEAFLGKGAFRDLLARIPVRVVLDDRAALLGAGRLALRAA
jgi:glucokinase